MAKNGWKWVEMVGNGREQVGNGWQGLEIAGIDSRWLETHKMAGNCMKSLEMTGNC